MSQAGLKRQESKPLVSRAEALWQGSAQALEQRGGGDAQQAERWKRPCTGVPQTSQPVWKDTEPGSHACRRQKGGVSGGGVERAGWQGGVVWLERKFHHFS